MVGNLKHGQKVGFSLAEMLLVMVILTILMIAMPPMVRKMFKNETIVKPHARVECYYGKLPTGATGLIMYEQLDINTPGHHYYQGDGSNRIKCPAGDCYCVIKPPAISTYVMVHGVGAGAGGNQILGGTSYTLNDSTAITTTGMAFPGDWPEWFSLIMQNTEAYGYEFTRNTFELRKTFRTINLGYGLSGLPGDRTSMLFPQLANMEIHAFPGKGGKGGVSDSSGTTTCENAATSTCYTSGTGCPTTQRCGQATRIKFKKTGASAYLTEIVARGGTFQSTAGDYHAPVTGGQATDFGIGNLSVVKAKSSEFESVLEDTGVQNTTKINKTHSPTSQDYDWVGINAGWGGRGSYRFVDGSTQFYNGLDLELYPGRFSYVLSNYTILPASSGGVALRDVETYVVTKNIDASFYQRNGATANCEFDIGTGADSYEIEINGYCVDNIDAATKIDFPLKCLISLKKDPGATPPEESDNFLVKYDNATNTAYFRNQAGGAWISTAQGSTGYTNLTLHPKFKKCKLNRDANGRLRFTCKTNFRVASGTNPNKTYQKCSYASNTYTGCGSLGKVATGGACNAGDGGNGAVVVLW